MKTKALVFSMLLLGTLLLAAPCLAADFYVYCSDGKIAVDSRAKHAGGVGSKCK